MNDDFGNAYSRVAPQFCYNLEYFFNIWFFHCLRIDIRLELGATKEGVCLVNCHWFYVVCDFPWLCPKDVTFCIVRIIVNCLSRCELQKVKTEFQEKLGITSIISTNTMEIMNSRQEFTHSLHEPPIRSLSKFIEIPLLNPRLWKLEIHYDIVDSQLQVDCQLEHISSILCQQQNWDQLHPAKKM